MKSKMSASPRQTVSMPAALAIARVKVKKKCHVFLGGPEHNTDVGHEISKAGLGVILCAGAIIGLSGFFFLVGGLIKSGGITGFVKSWLTAFTGI
jgi:hypothetical protein